MLSIVIVNWNTYKHLHACLNSIRAEQRNFTQGECEIIVVDNHSSDGSAEMVADEHPEVILMSNTENLGFARATNQGTRLAHGDLILYLNPDTEIIPGALRHLVDFMNDHPEAGAAGPMLLNVDKSVQRSVYPLPTLGREFWRLFHLDRLYPLAVYPLDSWDVNVVYTVDVIQGACLILRRCALDEVGLFDENFFMYTEDVDLCHRLQEGGWVLYWVPQVQVLHFGGQSTRLKKTEMFLKLYESKVVFFKKHYGVFHAGLYKAILVLASIPRLFAAPFSKIASPHYYSLNKETTKHYSELIRSVHKM